MHPRAIPQMADADEVWAAIDRDPAITYSALVPNLRGAVRALDAGCLDIEAVVSASDTHNLANVNRSTAESLDDIAQLIALAHERGAVCYVTVSTAWGCPYEGDVPVSRVVEVARRAVADGADGLSFGDTTGMATPTRVTALIGETRMALPDVAAESALSQHPGHRLGERAGGLATRRRRLRCERGRPRRLPLCARRVGQCRQRRTRAHGRRHGRRHRRRSRRAHRGGAAGRADRRPRVAVAGVARRPAHPA